MAIGSGIPGKGVVWMIRHQQRERALILAIEDDPDIQRLIVRRLLEADYDVITAQTAGDGFVLIGERLPDLILLDLNLPDGSGLGLIQQVRAANDTPIVIVSANAEEQTLVACLDAGADDYVTKPFRIAELLARIRTILRRTPRPPEPDHLRVGSLEVSLADRRVRRFNQELRLTPTEYRLLVQFARSPNRVFTHRALLTTVWGPEYADEPHVLRVTLNRLRGKLGTPGLIANRPAVGYTLEPDT